MVYGMAWNASILNKNVLELIMLPSDVCSPDIEDLVEDADTLV